jgi:trehalose 6-phosphate phosphatase
MTVQPASEELVDALIARLERARSALLMLDYDGTLAPFHVDPAQARPYPGVTEVLDAIMHDAGTRVVLISGRRAGDLRALLGVRTQPEVWGSHGWERLRPNGALSVERVPQIALDALITASSIALHWRGLPQERVSQLRAVVKNDWNALCRTAPLALLEFDGGLELRVTGRTKADAALAVLGECERDTPAAFLGDDTTDEDAFAAIQGRGLAVLVRPQLRPTAAQVWLQPPHELIAFLQRWQRARETHASGAAQ